MESEGFEVFETIYNDRELQGRWAAENGCQKLVLEANWHFRTLVQQVKQFQPHVVLFYAGGLSWVPRVQREQLRAVCERPVIIAGFWGDELPPETTYADYLGDLDYAFCSSSLYEKLFQAANIPACTVGNAFDDTIHFLPPSQKTREFVFCGATGYGYPDHVGRYQKLIELMRKSRLQIWTNEPRIFSRGTKEGILDILARCPRPLLRALSLISSGRVQRAVEISLLLKELDIPAAHYYRERAGGLHPGLEYFLRAKPLRKMFGRRVHDQLVDCSDYYRLLAESKLVLNLHRDEEADIGNIRCFEATGLGSCLITDHGPGLSEFFDIDNDIVTFETVDECIAKIAYLRKNPDEIERVARNGQRKTLARHTIAERCKIMAAKLRELLAEGGSALWPRTVIATYDIDKHPISYDFAFFLQAAEIFRKLSRARQIIVEIVGPNDIKHMAGVSKEADMAVDAHGREFRIFHICVQLAELMQLSAVVNIKARAMLGYAETLPPGSAVRFPGPELGHHASYYTLVNSNPALLSGLSATVEAQRYVRAWLDGFQHGRKLLCVTLRQYRFDPERNSNVSAWAKFLDKLDPREFAVAIVPDTDQLMEFESSPLGRYPVFAPACFDVDLRFALYEAAYLNMFVNTGPGVAAFLDKKVRSLMFKIVVPSVPHCTEDFLKSQGFEIGSTPKFATPLQKWVWANDDEDVLWREFVTMDAKIRELTASPDSAQVSHGRAGRVEASSEFG